MANTLTSVFGGLFGGAGSGGQPTSNLTVHVYPGSFSGSSIGYGSWTPPPSLTEAEIRAASRLLALGTASDDALAQTATGIAPAVGRSASQVEDVLRVLRELIALGALQEKLAGRP